MEEQKKADTKLRGKSDCFEKESRTVKSQGETSVPNNINNKTNRKGKKNIKKKVFRKTGDLGLMDTNDKFSSDSESSGGESAENLPFKAKASSNKLNKSKTRLVKFQLRVI